MYKNISVMLNYVGYYVYLKKEEGYKYANTTKTTPVKTLETNKTMENYYVQFSEY